MGCLTSIANLVDTIRHLDAEMARRMMSLLNLERFLSVIVLGILGSQLAGCSFLFSKGPKSDSDYGTQPSDCSGYALPVLDTVWAGLNGIGAMTAASTSQAEWDSKKEFASRSTTIAVGLLWLGISGASAIYGYSNASKCSEAMADTEDRPRYLPRPRRTEPSRPTYSPPPQYEDPDAPQQEQSRWGRP
jgi:hypothetical protein